MRVAIAVPNLTPHDAVSNDAVGMYEVLQAEGFECALFTIGGESAVRYTAQAYRDMGWWLGENDIVIYHYCTADATAVRDLTELKARLFIKYHNITPSGFFLGWSADYVRSTRLGRDMLHQIADLPVELFLSDSSFNMSELLDMGVEQEKAIVIPPFNQIDTLSRESDEPATVNYLSRNSNNILSVGRIVPNKGFEYMIKALASLNMTQTDKAHLHLVGSQDPRLLDYINHLKSLATELSLQNQVTFHPRVGSAALATYYRYSDVYFTASQHEGFCVPVVEAMAFGLPIVCSSAGALPETGGPCAIYADDPVSMSKALASILYSDSVRFQKRELSLSFYRNNFRHKIIQEKFVKMIRNLDLPAQSNLYRGDKNPTKEDENAFGLPAFHIYVDRYCRNEPIHEYRLRSQAYRKQLALETILKVKDDDLLSFLKSDRVLRYIESLDVPSAAAYINPIARLLWHLSSSARSRYSLSSEESVADFLASFWRLTRQNSTLDSFLSFREKKRLNDLLD